MSDKDSPLDPDFEEVSDEELQKLENIEAPNEGEEGLER